jgi:hypothetical protein
MTMTISTLDQPAIEAALQHIQEEFGVLAWPRRDEWVEVLALLRPGELRPTLAAWIDLPPKPYAVLDYILTRREPLEPPEPPPRRQRQITPTIQEIIDKAKADLGR